MLKSKGNVIDPREVMNKYGPDALRFWAAGSKLGEDTDYREKDLVAGTRFINKLRNASKFVFMNLKGYKGEKPKKLETLDKEFLKHLDYLVRNVTGSFERYNYSIAKSKTEQFFWSDFCDNYLEMVKKRIYQGKGDKKLSAQYTLYNSLLIILKMISPIMPFISEQIYQEHFKKIERDKSIHISEWPKFKKDAQPSGNFTLFSTLLSWIRQEKTKSKKSMNAEIVLTLDSKNKRALDGMMEDLKAVTNAKEIKEGKFNVEFV